MKRIIMCLSIAALSISGVYAQDTGLKAYQQKQEQELQQTIRVQKQQYVQEAQTRMQAKKMEVQNDLESRRTELMYRPEGMTALRLK